MYLRARVLTLWGMRIEKASKVELTHEERQTKALESLLSLAQAWTLFAVIAFAVWLAILTN